VDALTRVDTAGKRLDDGLPESLEEVIATYGQRYFKLKVAGSLDADIDRLARIAAVLDRIPEPYFTTLDGNEQFEHVDAVIALWRRIAAEPRLARLKASILFIEQPIARTKALAEPIHALAREIPVEIDESDADMGVFPAARALGYRGISAKSCKGFYRALLNRARIAHWNADREPAPYFMSCEDLTTQAGIAVQQDLALATLVGATHVERNGHHYVDGMAGASEREQLQFLTAHPELYQRTDGRVRLAIRSGVLALGSLAHTAGLAVGVMPEWDTMQPMRLSDRASAETASG
jgi:transcriptional regulator with XRE-family HTH domain